MDTIQIVLDSKLLRAADQAARRHRVNRSALIREALREYLNRLAIRDREARDRRGYQSGSDGKQEAGWEAEAVWPRE